jgi:hypothetical protein
MANQNNSWNTPPELLDIVRKMYGRIDLDPCSNALSKVNAKHNFMLPEVDGLSCSWQMNGKGDFTFVFVNPPYAPYYMNNEKTIVTPQEYKELQNKGTFKRFTIKNWMTYGHLQWQRYDCEEVFLIPGRGVGNSTWQTEIWPKSGAICFLKKRYPFWENGKPASNSGTFDLALVYYGNFPGFFKSCFSPYGHVVVQQP